MHAVQVFHMNLQKSRMYFCALAICDQIFDKMPIFTDVVLVPYISHWQQDSYYRGLVSIQDMDRLRMLMNASEQAKPMDEIDSEIKMLLDQAGPGSVPGTPPGAIEDSGNVHVSQAERERAHHITVQVLLGSSGSFDQNVKHFRVEMPDGKIAKVAFDNSSHSSGNRRGYVQCMRHSRPPEGHCACYRYRVLRQFTSQKRCVAYLAAWAWEASQEKKQNKKKSIEVKPSQVKSSQVKSSQAKSSQAKPSQVKSSQVKSSQAKSSQAKASQVKSSHVFLKLSK